jgi:hypothetical protein
MDRNDSDGIVSRSCSVLRSIALVQTSRDIRRITQVVRIDPVQSIEILLHRNSDTREINRLTTHLVAISTVPLATNMQRSIDRSCVCLQ